MNNDDFFTAQIEAERLLKELGINSLPVDPFKIAQELDITLKPLPASSGGASGMFIHVDGVFGIGYPTHIVNDGFINFSVSHEIGHYRLPGHIDAVLDENSQHISNAGFRSGNYYEKEADHFAASLLMPRALFLEAGRTAGEGLEAIEILSGECRTSLEATAIRFAKTNRDPVAVILSKGPTIEYAFMSEPLKEFPELEWIRKGTPLPFGSETFEFNSNKSNDTIPRRSTGRSDLKDWFTCPYDQDICEEVIDLGSYGKTLTVLTEMESPDEIDSDGDWESKWEPRFRR